MNQNWPKIFICIALLGAFGAPAAAQTEKRIDEIRKIYRETNERIAEANADGEYSSVYLAETVVNKNNGSYPAVGRFRTVLKFYYGYGDREKNPYPDRLLKIEVETQRAARTETFEYLFDDRERLVFYFESKTDGEAAVEKRLYFHNEAAIGAIAAGKNQSPKAPETIMAARAVQAEAKKLVAIFKSSLDY